MMAPQNWRYPDEPRDWRKGNSVGDMEWLLPAAGGDQQHVKPRQPLPSSQYACDVGRAMIPLFQSHPPLVRRPMAKLVTCWRPPPPPPLHCSFLFPVIHTRPFTFVVVLVTAAFSLRGQLSLDLHEDDAVCGAYIYSKLPSDPVAALAHVRYGAVLPLADACTTRFGEPIVEGCIVSDPGDGSLEDFIGSATAEGVGGKGACCRTPPLYAHSLARA